MPISMRRHAGDCPRHARSPRSRSERDTVIGVGDRGPVAAAPGGMARAEHEALAVLVSVQGLGPMTLERLMAACGSAAAVLGIATGPKGAERLVAASAATDDAPRPMTTALPPAVATAAERRALVLERVQALDL